MAACTVTLLVLIGGISPEACIAIIERIMNIIDPLPVFSGVAVIAGSRIVPRWEFGQMASGAVFPLLMRIFRDIPTLYVLMTDSAFAFVMEQRPLLPVAILTSKRIVVRIVNNLPIFDIFMA